MQILCVPEPFLGKLFCSVVCHSGCIGPIRTKIPVATFNVHFFDTKFYQNLLSGFGDATFERRMDRHNLLVICL
jgi:hypothetical protein